MMLYYQCGMGRSPLLEPSTVYEFIVCRFFDGVWVFLDGEPTQRERHLPLPAKKEDIWRNLFKRTFSWSTLFSTALLCLSHSNLTHQLTDFAHRTADDWMICFVCHPILCKPLTLLCVWKAQEGSCFWDTGSGMTIIPQSNSLKSLV